MEKARSPRRSTANSVVALLLLCLATGATGWIGWQLFDLSGNGTFHIARVCTVCGRVERVRELERASPAALPLNGDQSESIVMMIAALGGRAPSAGSSFHTYETAVRLDDGSIRIVREPTLPAWKAGDRVRVMRGRVEPLTRQG